MKVKTRIIIAEDDEDDQLLLQSAFEDNGFSFDLTFVTDGIDLMARLEEGIVQNNLPELILMDLNMPRKNGREILSEIRNNEELKFIPVLILSTSQAPHDIKTSYESGANAYIIKPSTYEELLQLTKNTIEFWFKSTTLYIK